LKVAETPEDGDRIVHGFFSDGISTVIGKLNISAISTTAGTATYGVGAISHNLLGIWVCNLSRQVSGS
jgi:hypothetical protein